MKLEHPKPTVRQETILAAVALMLAMAAGVLDALRFPVFADGDFGPLLLIIVLIIVLIIAVAQGWWIALDCRRLGRNPGTWWTPAAFLGVFTIPVYLIVAYREKAAVYIPLFWGLYAMALFPGPALRWANP